MRSLPLFHKIEGRMVVVLGDGAMAEPKRRLVERAGGIVATSIEQGAKGGARLCFIALDEADIGDAMAKAKAAGMLINVVDHADLCEFTTPSILERDPVLIAVGTSGASAGLAKQLRLRLEALLPANLGALAKKLSEIRPALRQQFPQVIDRRQAIDAALGAGGPLDPLVESSAGRVDDWLAGEAAIGETGTLEFVLAGTDPEDLTLRQARLLGCADLILFESNVPQDILDRARADAKRIMLDSNDIPENTPKAGLTVILKMA